MISDTELRHSHAVVIKSTGSIDLMLVCTKYLVGGRLAQMVTSLVASTE